MLKKELRKYYRISLTEVLLSHKYLMLSILLFSFMPIILTQLYFRGDDSSFLLWAMECDKPILNVFSPDPAISNISNLTGLKGVYRPFLLLFIMFVQHIVGNSPLLFYLINGVLFIAAVVLIYKTKLQNCYPMKLLHFTQSLFSLQVSLQS